MWNKQEARKIRLHRRARNTTAAAEFTEGDVGGKSGQDGMHSKGPDMCCVSAGLGHGYQMSPGVALGRLRLKSQTMAVKLGSS